MDQNDYFDIFRSSIELRGRNILEVGGSIPPSKIAPAKVKSWTSINISTKYGSGERLPAWYEERVMSVAKMRFPDNHFDAVFSSDCFEHVDDVSNAFAEIYRVLKPGGIFFTIFGPIWSGPVGHHTWVHGKNGKPITFNDPAFPDWFHLTHNRLELAIVLDRKYEPEDTEAILRYVYDSKDINRNTDSFYEREIAKHLFVPIIKYRIKKRAKMPGWLYQLLRERYPDVKSFETSGFFWVLAKDRKNPWYFPRVWVGTALELARVKLRRLPLPKILKPTPDSI